MSKADRHRLRKADASLERLKLNWNRPETDVQLERLLLASFLGLAATVSVSDGRAAEPLQPIAEPIDFLRVCDSFGAGFFVIPGTETCLRLGGVVRSEFHFAHNYDPIFVVNERGIFISHDGVIAAPGAVLEADRNFNEFTSEARAYLQAESRVRTEIGLIRTYTELVFVLGGSERSLINDETLTKLNQGFVQLVNPWGIFTAGLAPSFFDFYGTHLWNTRIGSDNPTKEATLFAFSYRIAKGLSATVSLEDQASNHRRSSLGTVIMAPIDRTGPHGGPDGIPDSVANIVGVRPGLDGLHGGERAPDVVANLRIDQAWGSAQLSAVAHSVRSMNFGTISHPETEIGWAVAGGARIRLPGTSWQAIAQATWGEGATRYVTTGNGAPVTDGFVVDSTGDGLPDDIALTRAWSVRGGVGGKIAEDWRASVAATYASVDLPGYFAPGDPIGNLDYDTWTVGGQIAWVPVSGFLAGVELQYERVSFDAGPETDRWGGQVRVQARY